MLNSITHNIIIALASAPGPTGGCGGAAPTLNGGVGAEPPPEKYPLTQKITERAHATLLHTCAWKPASATITALASAKVTIPLPPKNALPETQL